MSYFRNDSCKLSLFPIVYSCFVFMTESMKTCDCDYHYVLKFHWRQIVHIVYYGILIPCHEDITLFVLILSIPSMIKRLFILWTKDPHDLIFLYSFGLINGYVSFTKLLIFLFLTYPNFVIKPTMRALIFVLMIWS